MIKLKDVFDRSVVATGSPVREDVRADLRQGDLKVHEVAVVFVTTNRVTQLLDGFMKRLQSLFEVAERGMELKGLRRTAQIRIQ